MDTGNVQNVRRVRNLRNVHFIRQRKIYEIRKSPYNELTNNEFRKKYRFSKAECLQITSRQEQCYITIPFQHFTSFITLKKNQPISTRIKKWLDTTNTPLPKLLSPTPYIFPPWKMNLNTNTSMIQEIQNIEPSKIPKHFNDIILKNFCNHKIIYTDGSKSNVKTGLAIITDEETFKFSSLEINSIFTIEALTILKAIELTEQNWKNTKSFLIASDLLSSILAIQNQGTSNEIIKNIQERASSLAPRSVTFMWIPAHKNIPGNEKADVAAKEAASTNINIPKLDLSSFKDTARNSLINSKKIHQRLWDQELNNKLHQIKPFLSPNPNPPSSTRKQQVIWTRMKIGHTNISHVHLMRRESRPNCEFCNNAPFSTAHLLLECSNPGFPNRCAAAHWCAARPIWVCREIS
ncbi:hypothetical protein AGLY_009250 [Aphis glycines]|uniref:RNase H type-1 domain-containing protein n=1 Tax=Aphis glycines TaxID=307491 RepID=A0A6G0TIB6_APHGL|nr:hypothetical protein AGLY_009250 [Aphis glycines]